VIHNVMLSYSFICYYIAITVNFNQSMIRTKEDNEIVQFGLFFSNPSVFDLSISVNAISGTAMSKLLYP